MNQGVVGTNMGLHPTFLNDTIMAEVRSLICQSAENIILATSVVIGNTDIFKEPISIENSNASSLALMKHWDSSLTPGQ